MSTSRLLEARSLTFSYDNKQDVLKSVNLTVSPGELVLLTGPTGCGKSTLAKCLTGFIPHYYQGALGGQVLIDGENIARMSLSHIARKVALVQQDPESQVCTLNVSDEVAFGPENYQVEPTEIVERIQDKLAWIGGSYLSQRPTHAMSGGEKQRVVIAAMLACEPDYVILDEPSSSLDPPGIVLLRNILTSLKQKGLGILCIEHNIGAVRPVADRTLMMENGTLRDGPDGDSSTHSVSTVMRSVSPHPEPLLVASHLTFSYDHAAAVKDVSISAAGGEVIGIMGSNGSGKTTLLALLAGLLKPDSGQVILGGRPLRDIKRQEALKRVAVVFQNPNHQIFERTVWRDQMLAASVGALPADAASEVSGKLLERAGLAQYRESNPFSLSHGQKRRLNLTSTALLSPQVYLLDEPFIGQDPDGREFVSRLVNEMADRSGTCIVVTHSPEFVRRHCTRLVFMSEGAIVLDGPVQSVMKRMNEIGLGEYTVTEVD